MLTPTDTATAAASLRGGRRSPWKTLPRGLPVRITADGRYLGAGTVDAATPDGSVLWVLFTGMEGRRMFHRDDQILIEVALPGPGGPPA